MEAPGKDSEPGRASWRKGVSKEEPEGCIHIRQIERQCPGQGISMKARRREQFQIIWGNRKYSLAVLWGVGWVGAHREGCCPHRTLERSAKQMVGSLIRDQALRDGQVREEGLWLRGGEPGREATRGRTDSLGCCDVQWAMSNISGACGLEGNHICRMPGRAG